ncbi:SDR family oxidoreductase [Synoicihabitans lomoniglobus]|uniref:SDR family oxidoreductase n=1 Tax=Synoicihabitans lomoniglobus TaxID=2909285 RepID=A0AAE9ZUX2_9BACT|nr:SDR family oxidoreductase [Opitutaceae bacterium LMO-M01]WED63250.1 SDR family oxidoreductase [Opitutaceae bacterium LMO-M01]
MSSPYLESLFSLENRIAVVIGGTGELCGAMAEGLAGAGAEVVLVGRNEAKASARLERIAAAGGNAWFHAADATSRADLIALRDAVLARSGRIDVLVNGAGVNSPTPLMDIPEDEFDRIISANVKGVLMACQVFGEHLLSAPDGGSIINIGSASARVPLSRVFTYSASKAAVHNLTKNIAREWATKGVRVNLLVPGFFPAEQNRKVLTPDRVETIMGHTPMKRFGQAKELIGATLFLASNAASSFVTGAEIEVDGGFHAMTI